MSEDDPTDATHVPIVILRPRKASATPAELLSRSSYLEQIRAVRHYAMNRALVLTRPRAVVCPRTRRFRPTTDRTLGSAIAEARQAGRALLLDDAFRLVDPTRREDAVPVIRWLRDLDLPIHSAVHGADLQALSMETVHLLLRERVVASRKRSLSIRRGLDRSGDQDGPTKQAVRAGAARNARRADRDALRLAEEIDRVRAGLPEPDRSSHAAIARALSAAGVPTPRGGHWHGTSVKRALDRAGRLRSSRRSRQAR